MPRNAEVIRQWTILREIERARGTGLTVDELAEKSGVTTRTIRRDLQALEEAGFPIFDDRSREDGRTRWQLNGQAFKSLATGLTFAELCALHFSRTLVESLAGTPFRADVESAFEKLGQGLTPHMKAFLDELPRVIAAKVDPVRGTPENAPAQSQIVARALEGTVHQRQATIRYHSQSSDRTKTYLVHPYRLAYAQGAMYLMAYVPEYGQVRTFAADRIEEIALLEERFTPVEELPATAFPHSLGVHSGPPERVVIDFRPEAADYVRTRTWHPSQALADAPDGHLRVTLDVCLDRALAGWILSFGALARVVSPEALAARVAEETRQAHAQYMIEP